MRAVRIIAVTVLVWFGVLAAGVAAASAAHADGVSPGYTCAKGNVPPGTYTSMLISGVCYMPAGLITITGDLTVGPGALLDNGSPGDPSGSPAPVGAATLNVGGNVTVDKGAVLLIGCSINGACTAPNPPGLSIAHIGGSLTGTNALGVVVQAADIGGNFTLTGGGGGTMGGVANNACFGATPPAPWSEDQQAAVAGSPVYSDVEDSSIGGNYSITGMSSCWLGTLRDRIGGNATFNNNLMGDVDAMEIGNNLIQGNLACLGNDPRPQFGDGAAPDLVGKTASDQCGFNVVLKNPADQALQQAGVPGVGVMQHFVISTGTLRKYAGTYTSTPVATLESVKTDAGNTLIAQITNFNLTGNGLVGSGTQNGGPPGQSPGTAVLSVVHPDKSSEFIGLTTCARCSFAGQTGAVTFRSYGTVTPSGSASGTFLITSGGNVLNPPTSQIPKLATITGYGTFTSTGSTVHLVEWLWFS